MIRKLPTQKMIRKLGEIKIKFFIFFPFRLLAVHSMGGLSQNESFIQNIVFHLRIVYYILMNFSILQQPLFVPFLQFLLLKHKLLFKVLSSQPAGAESGSCMPAGSDSREAASSISHISPSPPSQSPGRPSEYRLSDTNS